MALIMLLKEIQVVSRDDLRAWRGDTEKRGSSVSWEAQGSKTYVVGEKEESEGARVETEISDREVRWSVRSC